MFISGIKKLFQNKKSKLFINGLQKINKLLRLYYYLQVQYKEQKINFLNIYKDLANLNNTGKKMFLNKLQNFRLEIQHYKSIKID